MYEHNCYAPHYKKQLNTKRKEGVFFGVFELSIGSLFNMPFVLHYVALLEPGDGSMIQTLSKAMQLVHNATMRGHS